MTVEEVYTNAFDSDNVAWAETGATPYLNDSDINYVSTNISNALEGDWTFAASGGLGVINSVKFRFEARVSALKDDDVAVSVWDGTAFRSLGIPGISSISYLWYEVDASVWLNTWAKINAAQIRLQFVKVGTSTGYVRRCTRKVDYGVAAALASRRLLVGVGL